MTNTTKTNTNTTSTIADIEVIEFANKQQSIILEAKSIMAKDEPFVDGALTKEQTSALKVDAMVTQVRSKLMKYPDFPLGVLLTGDQKVEAKQLLKQQLNIKAITQFELEERLKVCGFILRALNAKMGKDGIVKSAPIPEIEVAKVIMGLMSIKRVGDTDNDLTPLMVYDLNKGIYRENNIGLGRMINLIEPRFKKAGREETKALLLQNCEYAEPTKNANLAVLGNGIYNIETKEFLPFSPDFVFLTKASVNWNPDAVCPKFEDGWTFDGFLDEQFNHNTEDKYAMYQLLQLALLTNKAKKVFVYFYSKEGRTGKGTMTELIRHLVGTENSGSANLVQIESGFGLESVYEKSFIFGNENDSVWNTRGNDNIKNLATGDTLTIQRKGVINISTSLTPLIVQSMNSTPKFNNLESAITNRMRIFEFTHSYYDDDNERVKDEYVKNKDLLEYLAYKVLTMPVSGLVDTQTSKAIKNSIAFESNHVLEYAQERLEDFEGDTFTIAALFVDFRAWCDKSNVSCDYSRRMFSDKLIAATNEKFNYDKRKRNPEMSQSDLNSIMDAINGSNMSKNIHAISDFYNTNRQAVIIKK